MLILHRPEILNLPYYGPNKWKTKGMIYLHYLKIREGEPFIRAAISEFNKNKIKEISNEELVRTV